MKIIVNKRIHLSEVRASDQAAYLEHFQEKEIYNHTLRLPYPYTEANFQEWLGLLDKAKREEGRVVNWAIRNVEDLAIGGVGLEGLEGGKSHRAEMGYWLAKPFWGQGIITAVVGRVCEVAFEELGLVKLMAHVFADNIGSMRVLEKCRFVQEGYLEKHFLKDGKFLDARLMGRVVA
jgi:ribosomal-protein-alanine N-acetyltransferase